MKQSKTVPVTIQHRLMDARGTTREYHVRRVLRDLGGVDKYVIYKGTIIPVSMYVSGQWHGIYYG